MPVPREAATRSKRASQSGSSAARRTSRAVSQAASSARELLLARGHAGANAFNLGGKQLHLGAGLGQRGLLRLGALEAGVLLIFQALGFGGFEIDFVLDG